MKRSIGLSIAVLTVLVDCSRAQDKEQPVATSRPEVGRPGTGIGQLGLGVGVDPVLYTKSELLEISGIQDELGLTDPQRAALGEAQVEAEREKKRIFAKFQAETAHLKQQNDPAATQAYRQQTLAHAARLTRDFERSLLKVLRPEQVKRLEQIQIRADGYLAFSLPDVLDRLGLTPDQEAEIAACVKAGRATVFQAATPYRAATTDAARRPEAVQRTFRNSPDLLATATKAQAAVVDARSSTLRAIRKVLTNPQQATFRNMAGSPFDFGKLNPIKGIKPAPLRPDEN